MIYEKETKKIRVFVRPVYLKDQSSPKDQLFIWGYEIKVENRSSRSVQLLNRHWMITNSRKEVEEVWGPGVVGQQPMIRSKEHFIYSSFSRLTTSSGMMEGTYDMQSEDGDRFQIDIPQFRLEFPVRIVSSQQATV